MKMFNLHHQDIDNPYELLVPGKTDIYFLGSDPNAGAACPPFLRAGELGWDLVMPETFEVEWNGGPSNSDLKITNTGDPIHNDFVAPLVGNGLFKIKLGYHPELEEGTFLWIKGPTNCPISMDLYPVEGLVESDWFPAHSAMLYKVVPANKKIVLEKGKPYCRVLPYPKWYIEEFQPKYKTEQESIPFFRRLMRYLLRDKACHPLSKNYLQSYNQGFDGEKFVKNVKEIKLNTPEKESKCPFHHLWK